MGRGVGRRRSRLPQALRAEADLSSRAIAYKTRVAARITIADPRKVVCDPEARYDGGRVEEHSLVARGAAGLGRIGFDEWLRRAQAAA